MFIYAPRTKRSTWARVMDRGPRRAVLDMSEGTTKLLKANGMEFVIFVPEGK